MRIAFIVNSFPNISQTFILNQITGLMDLGHEVDIYAKRPGSPADKVHREVEDYGLMARMRFLPPWPKALVRRGACSLEAVGSNWRKDPGLTMRAVQQCASRRSLDPVSLLPAFSGSPRYDIVQCHFGVNGGVGLLMKQLGLASRVVVTFHAYELTKRSTELRAGEFKKLFEQADLLTPISEHWRSHLVHLGCDADKVLVHRMGVDLGNFKSYRRAVIGTTQLLTIARLVEKKGVEYAIRAVARVKQRYPENGLVLSIVGDGPLRPQLEALANQLGLEGSVRFLGWMDQGEIQSHIACSHIFLLPSVTASDGDQEGIPVSLMEAMATGMPVVSTLHSGIPELVTHGESGFLAPERDDETLASYIATFIEEPNLARSMGEVGRRFVEQNYDIEKLNRRLAGIYESLLAGKPISDQRAAPHGASPMMND